MKRMLVIVAGASALASFVLEGIAFPKLGSADPNVFAPPSAEAGATTEDSTSSQPQNSVAPESQSADEVGVSADHSSAEERGAATEQRVDPFSAEVIQ
jgi:hypothetical protein